MKEILPHIYMGTIPAEKSTQNDVNIYMIRQGEQALFIDCGYDTSSSLTFFEHVFDTFGLRPEKTALLLTHYHIDHVGMVWWFRQKGAAIYMSAPEYEDARTGLTRIRTDVGYTCGFHDAEISIIGQRIFDPRDYRPFFHDVNLLSPGDVLTIGSCQLQALSLPGHTPGQLGLYEAARGILFCGDHIIRHLAPVILTETRDQHFLHIYEEALQHVADLHLRRLFPAHNDTICGEADILKAIDDIRISYRHLCGTVRLVLKASRHPLTAYEITCKIYHRTRTELRPVLGLRQYLMAQKVLTCLEALYDEGKLHRDTDRHGALIYWQ